MLPPNEQNQLEKVLFSSKMLIISATYLLAIVMKNLMQIIASIL